MKDKTVAWKLFIKTKDIWDDLHPNKQPPIVTRRESFTLPIFTKKGRRITI